MILWTIGQNNVDVALASISHSSDIETEIRNSVRAGKVTTIHDSPVAYAGGTFVGYTIIDPITGAGAYKIGGGENGGILMFFGFLLLFAWIAVAASAIIGVFAAAGPLFLVSLAPSFLATLFFGSITVISAALALIFRGIEIIAFGSQDQAWACSMFQASVSTFFGGLLGFFGLSYVLAALGGVASNYGTSTVAPCLN